MAGNRYLLAFKSKNHEGKLNWSNKDIKEGKIPIVKAMKLAKKWCDSNKPFGDEKWEIDTVNLRFSSNNDAIEFI